MFLSHVEWDCFWPKFEKK